MTHAPRTIPAAPSPLTRRLARTLLTLTAIAAALPLSACYSKVISARGPGASNYTIEESDRDRVVLGEWFGDPPKPAK